jgi:cysteine-rich repeat protein
VNQLWEECDDGNTVDCDGCNNQCKIEELQVAFGDVQYTVAPGESGYIQIHYSPSGTFNSALSSSVGAYAQIFRVNPNNPDALLSYLFPVQITCDSWPGCSGIGATNWTIDDTIQLESSYFPPAPDYPASALVLLFNTPRGVSSFGSTPNTCYSAWGM